MKKILLIGKNGQLAQAILKEAHSFGYDITAFSRKEMNVLEKSQVALKIVDLKPDILINTSAYNLVPRAEEEPMEALKLNFLAVRNLAEICREKKIILVTYSTDYIFDGEKGAPYNENDAPNPLQVYGSSKLAGEYAALSIHPKGSFIIRTCGVYGGEKGSPEKGNAVLNIMKEAREKEIVEVSSEQFGTPTYAGDLSIATLKLLQSKAKPMIYHLINEGFCSWYEFTKEIFKITGIQKKLVAVDRGSRSGKMSRPKFSVLENVRAKALGIELPSWQDGLKSYFKFLKSL